MAVVETGGGAPMNALARLAEPRSLVSHSLVERARRRASACVQALERTVEFRRILKNARSSENTTLIPKGREGAAKMLRLMRDGLHFGAMMDQKLNEGVPIPFFGHDAMTATAPVEIALRTGGSIVPVRCIRYPGSRFRIEISPPLEIERTDDRKADAIKVLGQINGIIEDWIREYPEQWFWLHRRWPKE